ncbi:MAG: aminotransferase class IV [Gemmatimonadaceae bacterium]|nr:aminotransferase class IV [Gemmatimonadaceae bacterium]
MQAYLNGQYLDKSSAMISVDDRGFVFGDGIYEVYRAVDGELFEGARHYQRLLEGVDALRIERPREAGEGQLLAIASRLLRENGHDTGHATVYVEITRGAAPRAHVFPAADTAPTVFVTTYPFKDAAAVRAEGARAITQPDVRWLRCNIKTVQLLPNVLAKQAAAEAGAFEAILIRDDGTVTEGTHSNLFAVLDGEVRTHPATNLILPGITRAVILEIAAELGLTVREVAITEGDLGGCDELFLTGTTTDVMPVTSLDGRLVGTGQPGPIATQLYEALSSRMESLRTVAR